MANKIADNAAHRSRALTGTVVVVGVSTFLVVLMFASYFGLSPAGVAAASALTLVAIASPLLYQVWYRPLRDQMCLAENCEEVVDKMSRMVSINEFSDQLQTCESQDELANVVSAGGGLLLPDWSGAIYLLRTETDTIEPLTLWGGLLIDDEEHSTNSCWALRSGRSHAVNDPHGQITCGHVDPEVDSPHLCVPLSAKGKTQGILYVERNDGDQVVGEIEPLAQKLAESIGLAVANLSVKEELMAESVRDPLTGLMNRRFMEESLFRELHRAERNDTPVGLLMLDLDHFKSFNDEFGHDAGDTVLKYLSTVLVSHIRREDVACRYGGEEFLVIMPDATHEEARTRAEAIRLKVAELSVVHRGKRLPRLTVSIGVVTYPDDGLGSSELVAAVDMALYKAKEEGRDRVYSLLRSG